MITTGLLFYFLRYIRPTWYFNLQPQGDIPYWVDYEKLELEDQKILDFDSSYQTRAGALRDAAYQAWNRGIMHKTPELLLTGLSERVPVSDEYRFVRKYFRAAWAWYVLVIRLLTFRNPWIELTAFYRTLSVKRVTNDDKNKVWADYGTFRSGLVARSPLVSIIIPTLSRQKYLRDVFLDLSNQTYKNFEVLVVDQNESIDESFYSEWPFTLRAMHQKEKALWLARNTAVRLARGEYLLLYDDDSRVEVDWIEQHMRCLDYFNCQISAGVSISTVGGSVPRNYNHLRWADQLDTGNVMIKREVFEQAGLFDRQFERQRMGDGEFGLRCFLLGFQSISNPYARRLHLKVDTGGLRQMGNWDAFRPTRLLAPRPIPSVLYLTRRYFGNTHAALLLMIKTPPSLISFRFKDKPRLLMLGSLLSILLLPLVVTQVFRSWRLASTMIRKGPLIDKLTEASL